MDGKELERKGESGLLVLFFGSVGSCVLFWGPWCLVGYWFM